MMRFVLLCCLFVMGCKAPVVIVDGDGDGYEAGGGDCNDADATIFPGAVEVCDNKDNDCDGTADEDVKTTYYADNDDDSYGDTENPFAACAPIEGYTAKNGDCDDQNADVHPFADEVCDGIDNDYSRQSNVRVQSPGVKELTTKNSGNSS